MQPLPFTCSRYQRLQHTPLYWRGRKTQKLRHMTENFTHKPTFHPCFSSKELGKGFRSVKFQQFKMFFHFKQLIPGRPKQSSFPFQDILPPCFTIVTRLTLSLSTFSFPHSRLDCATFSNRLSSKGRENQSAQCVLPLSDASNTR